MSAPTLTPKRLTKQEFGRRVYREMIKLGWNQAELARQSNLTRDSISKYVRGISAPTPASLQKLAEVFGMAPVDLFPNAAEMAIDEDEPALDMKVSPGDPTMAWLRVNQLVPITLAAKIVSLLSGERHGTSDAG